MSRLAQWQTWVTIGAVLALILVVGDLALLERNRGLQFELASRQQFLQRATQMETLQRELINAIATLAARNNDAALRSILADHGIVPSAPPAGPGAPSVPPAGSPTPGRGR